MIYILGIITGLVLAIILIILNKKYSFEIQQILEKADNITQEAPKGYIAGLSEEEQAFKDSLLDKK